MSIVLPTDDNPNFQTLAGLKASISSRLDRTFSDSDLNDFIYVAEREMERLLTVPYRETVTNISVDAASVSLPSDFKALRRLTLLTDPKRNLQQVTPSVLDSNWPGGASGTPVAFAIIGSSLHFAPAPSATHSASIVYDQKLTALTERNPSNWLFESHPDVYFYGALVQAADHIADTPRIGLYRSAFENAIEQVNAEGRRYRYSASPMRLRSPVVV